MKPKLDTWQGRPSLWSDPAFPIRGKQLLARLFNQKSLFEATAPRQAHNDHGGDYNVAPQNSKK